MTQQLHFWLFIQMKRKQDLEEISVLPGSLWYYAQNPRYVNELSVNRWTDKEGVGYIYNGILVGCEKEGNPAICDNMNELWVHYAK